MTNPDQITEAAIVAAGDNVAPRITPDDITENIVHTEIVKHITDEIRAHLIAHGKAVREAQRARVL